MQHTKRVSLLIIATGAFALLFAFLLPLTVQAALEGGSGSSPEAFQPITPGVPAFTPITPEAGNPLSRFFSEDASLAGFFNGLFQIAISVGGLLAVLQLAYGGWLYMTSEIGSKKEEARERIRNALIGLLMLLATVLVLRQINPDIVSLNILQGFGVVQEQTVSTPGINDGPIDSGLSTGNPSGWCIDGNPTGGAHASDYERYLCFSTLQGCQQKQINGCAPYGGAFDAAYGPGSGRSLPVDATDYYLKWQTSDPSLSTCHLEGKGWKRIDAAYCGTTQTSVNGQCCGIPKSEFLEDGQFWENDVASIPAGNWCNFANDRFTCYSSEDACMIGSGTTDCIMRVANGWAGGETTYSTSDLTAIPNNSFCYRSPTTAYCTNNNERQCALNQALFEEKNPSVPVQECALFSK